MPNIMLGADPEFDVESLEANDFIPACEAYRTINYNSRIGYDGCSSTGEMRPCPFNDPIDLFKDIEKIIKNEMPKLMNPTKFAVYAGSGKHTACGGHIHISGLGQRISVSLAKNLDKFCYFPLIEVSNTSRRGSYNRPSVDQHGNVNFDSVRSQPHGGFEYRATPSWICHPIITRGILVTTYLLAKYANNRVLNNKLDLFKLAENPQQKRMISAMYRLLAAMKNEKKIIENFNLFESWKVKIPKEMRKTKYEVQWDASGYNMRSIFVRPMFFAKFDGLRFVGVNRNHDSSETEAFFMLPEKYKGKLPPRIGSVRIEYWQYRSVGMSYFLRTKKTSFIRKKITLLIWILNRLERGLIAIPERCMKQFYGTVALPTVEPIPLTPIRVEAAVESIPWTPIRVEVSAATAANFAAYAAAGGASNG